MFGIDFGRCGLVLETIASKVPLIGRHPAYLRRVNIGNDC